MPWFKRSSGEEPTEAPVSVQATATDAAPPVLEPLTPAEVDWIRSNIGGLAEQDVRLNDIDDLGRHYDELLAAWLRLEESRRPDPNQIITQIGLGFGQYVADQARLDWTVATDEHGAEIALHRARGNVLIYPTNLVAKRWAAEQLHTLPALARQMIATVEQIP
jgi:hypothetical protein